MTTTESKARHSIDLEIEKLRQQAIAAQDSAEGKPEAVECIKKLNHLYQLHPAEFTPEDIRFVNVLKGTLASRLEAKADKVEHTHKLKRKGDKLDHCWRCQTPVDERFTVMCPTCSDKSYQWRRCPVCDACGCQRAGTVLV